LVFAKRSASVVAMTRFSSVIASATAIGVAVGVVVIVGERPSQADLDNQVFTSKTALVRLVVPRGWRATDQPSYPGVLLWMLRSEPEGRLALTAEPFTREVYCSWPITCRSGKGAALSLPAKAACALRSKLLAQHMRTVGDAQAGPKENDDEGLPSVWFEYDDGKHFMRQAIAIDEDRVVSLVLSTQTNDARAGYVRAFEQALRTMRPVNAEEQAAITASVGSGSGSAAAIGVGATTAVGPGLGSAMVPGAGSGSGSGASPGTSTSAGTESDAGSGSGSASGSGAPVVKPFATAAPAPGAAEKIPAVGSCSKT